jgi:hypothetical protein
MTREEHLAAAKTRALALLDKGNPTGALDSIMHDLGQFPGLMRHPDMSKLRHALIKRDPEEIRKVIEALK